MIKDYGKYYQQKREDGFRFIHEMVEQHQQSYYGFAIANKLNPNYVASAIMFANFSSLLPNTESITILEKKPLENYSNPMWAVTLTTETEWLQNYELNILALPTTTDERAINYMRNKF